MTFTFIHTADWQIGKAFAQFDADVGAQLRAARLEAIDRIAGVAGANGAQHVIVAGDVFDSELIEDPWLRQPLARMAAYSDLAWHLLPGNHDPARGGGIWERLVRLGLPPNVTPLTMASPYRITPNVVLLPSPLAAKEMRSDPTGWMDHAESGAGDLRIGVAHGSVRGFGSLGEAAVPIDAGRRRSAGLDYLALGDWHGTKKIAAGVWYAGTPEADSFANNDPGHVLVVSIAGQGSEPAVTRVATGCFRWFERRAVISRIADFAPLESEIAMLGANRRHSILKLVLEGAIGAADAAAIDARVAQLAALPLATLVDQRRLRVLADAADRDRLADPLLAAVADRLIARGQHGDAAEARVAARSMRLLLSLDAGLALRVGAS
ncbi:MAG: exonuclease SbcCD subunit D [Hyphomicrobiaceae bacterium]